jgi:hypothetical protein
MKNALTGFRRGTLKIGAQKQSQPDRCYCIRQFRAAEVLPAPERLTLIKVEYIGDECYHNPTASKT